MEFETLTAPIRQSLDAQKSTIEAWRADHERAKQIYRSEDILGGFVELFDRMERLDAWMRKRVMEDPSSYSEPLDDTIRQFFREFHQEAAAVNDMIQREYGDGREIDNLDSFRRCLASVEASATAGYEMDARMDLAKAQAELRSVLEE